ncbi:MAG TPA: hypothetical protein VFB12_20210 [Ktedonobacteraceae bacterium]|nr:hypothetical protein [Ktedonobacteraceae bacterium]
MYGDNSSSSTAYSTPTTKDITQPSYALSSNLLTENASSTLLLTEIVERAATPLPSARTKLAATAAGSKAIFVGGDPAGGRGTTEVDIYDANIGHWMPPGPNDILSVPRSSLAATTVGNLSIFAGGLDHQGAVSNVVDIYNANTGQWTPGQSLSVPRSGLAATTVGNTAIFAGGVVSGGAASNAMDIYNPATTGQWTSTNLRAPCSNIAATSVASKALFAGKWVSSEANLLVDIYDTTSGWGAKYYSTAPRFNLAATTVGSKAIFAGGITSGGAPSDAVDIYDANINQWSQAKLSVARSNLAATTVGNFAIFAGGIPSGAVASDVVDIYNADTGQWAQAKLSVPRSSLAASTVGNLAIFAGGTSNGGGVSNVVDIFAVSNVIYDNYATDAANTARDRQSQVSHLASNLGLSHIRDSASVLTVKNQPDWFAFNNGDEAFLAVANASTLQPISDGLAITDQQNSLALSYSEDAQTTTGSYAFIRLTTSTIQQLSQKAFIGGIDRLLTPDSQLLPELNFSRFQPSNAALAPVNQQLDFQIEILQDNQAIAAYNDDPFDPYAIAQIRIGAYQKAVVMKYIDNLLSWGDSLFAQDTWEAIAQATMLYFLAYDLLGPRPENVGQCPVPALKRYADLKAQYNGNVPQFLLQLEQQVVNTDTSTVVSPPFNAINAYFCVSKNDQFIAYWDRVEDRLHKIRHCQNIAGVVRQLALFEPPINPADLVRAAASGNVAISAVAGLRAEVSNYRFDYLLERAKNITTTLMQFGSTLLSVLEKKDAEQLALLRATQEAAILQLIKTTKEKQKKEAEANLASLKLSQKAAQDRYNYYNDLISRGLSAAELNSLLLMETALIPQYVAGGLNLAAAVIFAFVPTIYGAADGGQSPGMALSSMASASEGAAAVLNQGASLGATLAQYARRTEEWLLQRLMAQDDVNLISQQIDPENGAAQIAIDIAQSELDAHLKSIEQANEVEDFLKRKFSNQDLYQWTVNRLSVLYFQTFKLALDMALVVQKAYQYELNRDDTYISFDYWDNLRQGLLAGEGLMLGLNQLEKAYIEGNVRRLEIEKTISLLQLAPQAFLDLKTSGKCQFQLSESLFDYDFPGHYCRQIKSIALTIPAVVGPYQNIHATLTQLSDRVLVQPNEAGVNYLLNGGNMPDASILRSSWRRNQKIAISRGVNDAGLFELNFRDERYLPFEGTGAVSTWELSMPKATNRIDFESLSDVIIHLSYTALDAGDSAFTAHVQSALNPYKGAYYMSFNQTFSGPWHTFLSTQTDPRTQQLKFSLSNQIIPPHITNVTLTSISLKLDVPDGALTSGAAFLSLQIGNGKLMLISFSESNLAILPVNSPVDQFAGDWVMSVDLTNAPQALIKNGFLDPAVVQNIECILWYEGEISWNS